MVKLVADPEKRPEATSFFKNEYECDRFIAHMSKPIVAILDGITSASCRVICRTKSQSLSSGWRRGYLSACSFPHCD